MEVRKLICINCPLGCPLTVTLEEGEVVSVVGNTCPRGESYGRKEVSAPTRTLTSIVRVRNGHLPVVSVKTSADIPKGKIGSVMDAVHRIDADAPIAIGQVLLKDAAGTGVDIVATKAIRRV